MRNTFVFAAGFIVALACNPVKYFESHSEEVDIVGDGLSHGMIVLGQQLEDPYSVENMTKALNALYPTKAASTELVATHLYVRLLPQDEEQFASIEALGVEMLDHPVDFEIVQEGDYYHDPSVPEEDITWQYAVVDYNFKFPEGVRYEVLDRCYLSESDPSTKADGIDWEAVEREAFKITGNEDMLVPQTKGRTKYTPEGRITIYDPAYSDEPFGLAEARISCNVFVKFARCFTDSQGNYQMNKAFAANPRYRIVFKNKKGFSIGLNTILFPASVSTLGCCSPQGINVEVGPSSNRMLFLRCAANNTAWEYYEKCSTSAGTISTPPSNLRIWLFRTLKVSSCIMMQQGVGVDGTLIGELLGEYAFIVKKFLPDITVGIKGLSDYASIYSLLTHELAHASHYSQVGNAWWQILENFSVNSFVTSGFVTYGAGTEKNHGYCEVAEMWAYYVQTKFYRERYPDSDVMFGTSYWFYPQILWYMDERGLTRIKIFGALVATVTDRDQFRERLVSLYPESKMSILLAFNRYK